MNETWLAHHGIPGMKWGVRRFENKDGTPTEAGKSRYSKYKEDRDARKQAKKERKEIYRNRKTLSDQELNQMLQRLQNEKKLKEMMHPGRAFVKDAMKSVGQKVLVSVAAGTALYLGKAIATGKFDNQEFGSAIFNGGPKKK